MKLTKLEKQLLNALEAAKDHLEYCGYGDSWERECAGNELPNKIEAAIEAAHKKSNIKPIKAKLTHNHEN